MYRRTYRSNWTGLICPTCVALWFLTGYTSQALAQGVEDSTRTFRLQEYVITASRLKEEISRSPVTIEKITFESIERSASPSFFDALEYIKGVQMITPSLGFRVINTRGFSNTTNVRFAQLVDGMDNQAPHLGAPIANALGPNDLDIESVEIIPGVASALYGMNAINGLANFVTKDPFTYAGLSIQQKIGVNRVGRADGARPYTETSMRWAYKLHPKVAFKINGTYLRGTDWIADDFTDLNQKANVTTGLTGEDNPAYDAVNSYGNESPNRRTLSLMGKNYVVARTGYEEQQVVDYNLQNLKGDATLSYAPAPDQRLTYTFRFADLDNVYQRANRFRLQNYKLQQHGLSYSTRAIQVRAYLNMENTGESYNARSMAENIDRHFKSDDQWFSGYITDFNSALADGATVADAHRMARSLADAGRPLPGTEDFQKLLNELADINNWDYGAALRVKSKMLHAEAQLNITEQFFSEFQKRTGVEVLAGADYRTYSIVPDGNYFINPAEPGDNIMYGKTGAFLQVSGSVFREKVKLGATMRIDKNEYFSLKWNPRITVVYSPADVHNIRFSYQNGYRFPSVFEAFSNVNSGGVKRVGGLPVMSSGIFESAYYRTSIDIFQAAVNRDVNTLGITQDEAIVKNEGLLRKNDYTYVQPEHIQSVEAGYRGEWFNGDVQVDIDLYYNKYDQFIAQVEMNVPTTDNPDSIPFYLYDKKRQDRYRMWTNSRTVAYNYGSSLGVRYRFLKKLEAGANVTFSKLQRKSDNDGLEDGFNTPQWMTNLSVGGEKIIWQLGFRVTCRWQSSYYWQSFLVSGEVPAYSTVDGQLSYQFGRFMTKVGGTNILNRFYRSYLGGPSVGGFYYTSLTVNL